jgi:hypothetical protein
VNSRPAISLSIFADNINLNTFSNSSVQILNSTSQCDSNMICTTILELNVTFNDQYLYSITSISCNAFNTTMPYNLNITEVFNVHIDIPSSVCI